MVYDGRCRSCTGFFDGHWAALSMFNDGMITIFSKPSLAIPSGFGHAFSPSPPRPKLDAMRPQAGPTLKAHPIGSGDNTHSCFTKSGRLTLRRFNQVASQGPCPSPSHLASQEANDRSKARHRLPPRPIGFLFPPLLRPPGSTFPRRPATGLRLGKLYDARGRSGVSRFEGFRSFRLLQTRCGAWLPSLDGLRVLI